MVVAQALGEYAGTLGRVLADAVTTMSRLADTLIDSAQQAEPITWLAIFVVVFFVWLVFRNPKPK